MARALLSHQPLNKSVPDRTVTQSMRRRELFLFAINQCINYNSKEKKRREEQENKHRKELLWSVLCFEYLKVSELILKNEIKVHVDVDLWLADQQGHAMWVVAELEHSRLLGELQFN